MDTSSRKNENESLFTNEANSALQRLYKSSWIIMFLSLIIDTSHERSFPSYNMIIGVWSCSSNFHFGEEFQKKFFDISDNEMNPVASPKVRQSLGKISFLKSLSALCLVTTISLVTDVIFCFVWGDEILSSKSASTIFCLYMFIGNMIVKTFALFQAGHILLDASDSDEIMIRAELKNRRVTFADIANSEEEKSQDFSDTSICQTDDGIKGAGETRYNTPSVDEEIHFREGGQLYKKNDGTPSSLITSLSRHANFTPQQSLCTPPGWTGKNDSSLMQQSNLPLPPYSPGMPGLVSPGMMPNIAMYPPTPTPGPQMPK